MTKIKQPRGFSLIEGVIIVAIVCVIAGLGYYGYTARNKATSAKDDTSGGFAVKDGRSLFYVVSAGVGGPCMYYVADDKGKSLEQCVDPKLIQGIYLEAKTEPNSELSRIDDNPSVDGLLMVDADVRVVSEERSGATPKPEYTTKQVVYIDKIYDAKIVVSP